MNTTKEGESKEVEKAEIVTILCGTYNDKYKRIISICFNTLTDYGYLVFVPPTSNIRSREFYTNLSYQRILAADIVLVVDQAPYNNILYDRIHKAEEYNKPVYHYYDNGLELLRRRKVPKIDKEEFFNKYGNDIKNGKVNRELGKMIYEQLSEYLTLSDYLKSNYHDNIPITFTNIIICMVIYKYFPDYQNKFLIKILNTELAHFKLNDALISEQESEYVFAQTQNNINSYIDFALHFIKENLNLPGSEIFEIDKFDIKSLISYNNITNNDFIKNFFVNNMDENNEEVKNELKVLGFIDSNEEDN